MNRAQTGIGRFWAKAKGSEASLYMYGDVGGWFGSISAKEVANTLKQLGDEGVKSLCFYVNSYGGDVFEGFAIYNVVRRFDGDVTMCVDGVAASAASIICMAGDTIQMSPAGSMMIHEARTMSGGTADQMEKAADRLRKLNESMAAVYAARTGKSEASVRKMMAAETWFTAQEALDDGFCDELLTDDTDTEARGGMRLVASGSPVIANYLHVPAALLARIDPSAPPPFTVSPSRKEKKMSKKNKLGSFVLFDLGLPPDASGDDVRTALAGLKERARASDVTRAKIEAEERTRKDAEERARREREGEPDLPTLVGKGATDAAEAQKARADAEKRLCDLTDEKSYSEALGKVLSWKNTVAEVEQLKARIAELEHKGQGATAEALVEQAIRENKIAPAQKDQWLALAKKDPEMFKGFLKTAPALLPKKRAVEPENESAMPLAQWEIEMAAKMGITDQKQLEAISKHKQRDAAARAS